VEREWETLGEATSGDENAEGEGICNGLGVLWTASEGKAKEMVGWLNIMRLSNSGKPWIISSLIASSTCFYI